MSQKLSMIFTVSAPIQSAPIQSTQSTTPSSSVVPVQIGTTFMGLNMLNSVGCSSCGKG